MSYSAQDIQEIIQRVTEEVLGGLSRTQAKLAVFCGNVFDPRGVKQFFAGKDVVCALPDDMPPLLEGCKSLKLEADKRAILDGLDGFEEIFLVTPPLSLLGAIAEADDTSFAASLIIRPLLWGRKVTVLLDFESPKYLRGTALGVIADNIDALEKMGINIATLKRKTPEKQGKELVTEQDVKDAIRDGSMKVKIAPGAIVTQLAQDTAKECGVSIEY
jgi:hypothetical protein